MRICLPFFVLILFFSNTNAQQASKKLELGLSIEPLLNISTIGFKDVVDNKGSLGFEVNGDIYFRVNSFLQLRSGLGVQQVQLRHGEKYRWPSQNMNGEWVPSEEGNAIFKSNYTFLNLPADLKIYPLKKLSTIFFNVGIGLSHKLSSGGKIEFNEPGGGVILSDPEIFDIQSPQLFSMWGVGIEWKSGAKKFFINPVYQASFSDIFSDLTSYHNGKFKFIGLRIGVY